MKGIFKSENYFFYEIGEEYESNFIKLIIQNLNYKTVSLEKYIHSSCLSRLTNNILEYLYLYCTNTTGYELGCFSVDTG